MKCNNCNSRMKFRGEKFGFKNFSCSCGITAKSHKGRISFADQNLRSLRISAHSAFDMLWQLGPMNRGQAYKWLGQKMGMNQIDCHIGLFDEEQCRKVIDISLSEVKNHVSTS